jgi:hypothetical protein
MQDINDIILCLGVEVFSDFLIGQELINQNLEISFVLNGVPSISSLFRVGRSILSTKAK